MQNPEPNPRESGGPASERRVAFSLAELQSLALPSPLLPSADPARTLSLSQMMNCGMQELLNLSDDLLLVRSDLHMAPTATHWDIDTRGWLYLHCRLDGISEDETPDGAKRTVSAGCFFMSSSSQQRSFVREVLTDHWRVITVAFRPSFAMRDLQTPGTGLPEELRQFRSGETDLDFWFASQLTPDMKSAAGALLQPTVSPEVRPIYLRAKVVELICLAMEHLRHPAQGETSALKLTQRDLKALEEARRLLDESRECLSLEQLARHAGLNRRKLALGFKHVFGVTAGEYQREVRLELARRLLEKPSTAVSYAAAMAGYSDLGSFSKAFQARYGVLPSRLRLGDTPARK